MEAGWIIGWYLSFYSTVSFKALRFKLAVGQSAVPVVKPGAAEAHCCFHHLLVMVSPVNIFIAFRYQNLSTREVLLVPQNHTHPVTKAHLC